MFVFKFLFPIFFLISLAMSSTPKLSKLIALSFETYKAIQWVPIFAYSSRFITYGPSFMFLDKLSLE